LVLAKKINIISILVLGALEKEFRRLNV